MDRDLAFTPGYRQREMIASREISPVELTELYLRRIEELNPRLNAFLTVASEQAMEAARQAEQAVAQGDDLGPLHGVAVSIKDLASTKGIRTTRGSLVYEDQAPDEDDIFVERLRQAGTIILGKTNTPEFGEGGGVTENRLGPNCNNPWNPQMTSGASSGGRRRFRGSRPQPHSTRFGRGGVHSHPQRFLRHLRHHGYTGQGTAPGDRTYELEPCRLLKGRPHDQNGERCRAFPQCGLRAASAVQTWRHAGSATGFHLRPRKGGARTSNCLEP